MFSVELDGGGVVGRGEAAPLEPYDGVPAAAVAEALAFYAELLRLTGLEGDEQFAKQMDKAEWPALKSRLTELFAQKTRDEWCGLMEATDVCFAPVLTMSEAAQHPHNVERHTFIDVAGTVQPAPAPRFSRTHAEVVSPPAHPGAHTREVFEAWGVDLAAIDAWAAAGAIRQAG